MSERAREWVFWITATILVALAVHMAAIYLAPRLIMMRTFPKLGATNVMHVGKRPDANSRAVVRPSPDILYASCPYDLSKGPLRVTAPVPHWTYWSASAFDAQTDNFYVIDDQKVTGNSIELLFVKHGQPWPALDNALQRVIIFAPGDRGVILLRAVIDDDRHIPALQSLLRQAKCETVASAARLR